jgi:hypothetical protein
MASTADWIAVRKPETMFAFTATPEACCAACVPKAPRWQPVNCVPVLAA